MAVPRTILEADMIFQVEAGEQIERGELVYYSSGNTDWRLSDANDETTYAQGIAVTRADKDGDDLMIAKRAVVIDEDDNGIHTAADTSLYLSETAGTFTATRPTTAETLLQRVGTSIARVGDTGAQAAIIDIKEPVETTINLQFPYTESAAPQDFDGDFHGVGLDDTNAAVGAAFMVPKNANGTVVEALLWWCGTGTALDSGDTYTFDVSAGIDDDTTSTNSDGLASSPAPFTAASNDLANGDVSTAFTGTDIIVPGNVCGVDVKKAAESSGQDPIMLCVSLTLELV